jgi:hypothetical protein
MENVRIGIIRLWIAITEPNVNINPRHWADSVHTTEIATCFEIINEQLGNYCKVKSVKGKNLYA